jgi:glycosyltransferase involved in cell wall biosynthesis
VELIPLCVEELVGSLSDLRESFDCEYAFRSFRFAEALKLAHAKYRLDYVEFVDYCGAGFFSFAERLMQPDKYPKIMSIHLHNTIEIIDQSTYGQLIEDRRDAYVLERTAMPMADCYISHGRRFFETEYQGRYLLDPARVIIHTPAVPKIPNSLTAARRNNRILFYGRQSRLKGLDIFLGGAVRFLAETRGHDVLFTIIGPSDSVTDTNVSVDEIVPRRLRHYFEVIGEIDRDAIATYATEAKCAVFPNRSESFCFALHELFQLGIPIIANDIAGFRDHCDESEVLFFDGTIDGLSCALARLLSDDALAKQLRARKQEHVDKYNGGEWARTISLLPSSTPPYRVETVLILSFGHDRSDIRPDGEWTLLSEAGGKITVFDITLEQEGGRAGLHLFARKWYHCAGLVEAGAFNRTYDLIIFLRKRSSLSESGVRSLVDIARRNHRSNALLVMAHGGEIRSASSRAIEATLPRGLSVNSSDVALYALWNWSNYTLRDFEGLLHHAPWHGIIPALASRKTPWIVHLPSDVFGLQLECAGAPKHVERLASTPRQSAVRTTISINPALDSLQTLTDAILTTKSDPDLFYVFNPNFGTRGKEVWIAGERDGDNTVVFEGARYQMMGDQASTKIDIDGLSVPVMELRTGFLRGRMIGHELCTFLMHAYSGSVLFVVAGELIWDHLYSDTPMICRCIVEFSDRVNLRWRRVKTASQYLFNSGSKTRDRHNYLEMLNTDGNGTVRLRDISVSSMLDIFRDPKSLQQIINVYLGPQELVTLIEIDESVVEILKGRITLRHSDFWAASTEELTALAKLTRPLFARHIGGNLAASSPQLVRYFAGLGIDISLRAAEPEARAYCRGRAVLVIAIPEIITSCSHMMSALSLFSRNHAPVRVYLTSAAAGQIFMDGALFPDLTVTVMEEEGDSYPESLPGIGAVICLYPYTVVSKLLTAWMCTDVPVIVSSASAESCRRDNVHEVVLWDDAFAILEKLETVLGSFLRG